MEEARNGTSLAIGHDEEQKGCYSGSTKREEKGPLCHLRDSVQFQTAMALYEQENIRSNEQPSHSRLKTSDTTC